jgi:hypothetical protein
MAIASSTAVRANSSETSPRSDENANERTFGSTSSRLYRNISMKRA